MAITADPKGVNYGQQPRSIGQPVDRPPRPMSQPHLARLVRATARNRSSASAPNAIHSGLYEALNGTSALIQLIDT